MKIPAPHAAESAPVLRTRIFKSGNSLSVRIPSTMVPANLSGDAEIEYKSGVWTIRPVQLRKLKGLAAKFAAFSTGFMSEGREPQSQTARNWSVPLEQKSRIPAKRKK